MTPLIAAFIAVLPAPQAAAASPRFEGLFVNWTAANRDSIEAERAAAARPTASAAATAPVASPGSSELGQRVGEIVALGDCAEGERVARSAGDFALVRAVRDHCNAGPAASR